MRFIFLLTLALSGPVFAKNDCASDAEKFCSNVEFGKGQVAKCLSEYKDQISPACAKEMNLYDNNTAKKNPCYKDLADFCADLPTDGPKSELCLLKNEARLSPTCAKDFKAKKPKLIVKNECAQDIVNNCYSELAGPEGAVNKCLITNRLKLSKFCQNTVDLKVATIKKNNPCFDDTLKHCPKAVKVIDIQECLEKKIPALVPQCQKVVEQEQEKGQRNPCYKDLVRHCKPNIAPQDQMRCLTVNDRELSSSCKHFRVQESKRLENMVTSCEADRLKFCATEPMKDGKVAKCLRKNKATLSPACKSLIK